MSPIRRASIPHAVLIDAFFLVIGATLANNCRADTPAFAGAVVDSQGQPLASATVTAGHVMFQIGGPFFVDGHAVTDAQGKYAITTLGAGDGSGNYILTAALAGHVPEVYPETPCYTNCPGNFPPVVAVPNLSANFQLFQPGSISGHVIRTDTNSPLPQAVIQYANQNAILGAVYANASGDFTISNLLPGQYELNAESSGANEEQLLPQVYAGHDFDFTLARPVADQVQLADGQNLSGIDFALHVGAVVDGMITSSINGDPLLTLVSIRRLTPVSSGDGFIPTTYSDGYTGPMWGHYRIAALMPGTFHIEFGSGAFAPQFYPNASTEAQAQSVVVTGPQAVTGIDGQATPLQTFAGTVKDAATGVPLPGVIVHSGSLVAFSLGDAVDARTDANGNYLLQGLGPTSPSQPHFFDYIWISGVPTYLDTFYPNVTGICCFSPPATAQALQLAAGQQLTGYDFAMGRGANASGRVYDPDTGYAAPAFVQIEVLNASGTNVQYGQTDSAGNYAVDAVPLGSYYMAASFGNYTLYYPDYFCTTNCQLSNAQLLNFTAPQNYVVDFAFSHLDLVFRSGFE